MCWDLGWEVCVLQAGQLKSCPVKNTVQIRTCATANTVSVGSILFTDGQDLIFRNGRQKRRLVTKWHLERGQTSSWGGHTNYCNMGPRVARHGESFMESIRTFSFSRTGKTFSGVWNGWFAKPFCADDLFSGSIPHNQRRWQTWHYVPNSMR